MVPKGWVVGRPRTSVAPACAKGPGSRPAEVETPPGRSADQSTVSTILPTAWPSWLAVNASGSCASGKVRSTRTVSLPSSARRPSSVSCYASGETHM